MHRRSPGVRVAADARARRMESCRNQGGFPQGGEAHHAAREADQRDISRRSARLLALWGARCSDRSPRPPRVPRDRSQSPTCRAATISAKPPRPPSIGMTSPPLSPLEKPRRCSPEIGRAAHHRLGKVYQAEGHLELKPTCRNIIRPSSLDKEYVAAMIGLGSIEAARQSPLPALVHYDEAIEL